MTLIARALAVGLPGEPRPAVEHAERHRCADLRGYRNECRRRGLLPL